MTPPPHSNPDEMRENNIVSFLTDTDFHLFCLVFLREKSQQTRNIDLKSKRTSPVINTTITHSKPTHGTVRKRYVTLTVTRHQKDKILA